MTAQSSPALVKWKNWIGTTNIGVYPYNGGPTWFKPTQNGVCKMEVLNQQFCYVCRETFIEVIHTLVSPIEAFTPSNISVINVTNTLGFKLNLIAPVPNTLKRIWTVDGNTAANNVDTFTVLSGSMATGNHTVLATVLDTTAFTRYVNHISLHTYNVQWNLSVTAGGISSSGLDLFKASLKIFPNPFADNLTVEYELDKNSSIGIQLVTAEGKTINLLSEKQQSAGKYSFPLSMKQLATGSYFVVLIINGKRITKELVKLE